MKKRIFFVLLIAITLMACGNTQVKQESKIIKQVGKEVVTEDEVNKELNFMGIKEDETVKKDVIENLVIQKMLKQEAKNQGLDKDERYKTELSIVERSLLASLALEENVYKKVSKDDKLLNKYFEENKNKFDFEQVKIAHIVIRNVNMNETEKKETLTRAQEILKKVQNGEDFYELAVKYSEVPDSKWNGIIGYISRGDMVTPIEEVAFNNDIGLYPQVVETIYGYEIILIIDKKGKKASLNDLSESEKNEIKDLLLNDYYNNYINELKEKYKVK